MARKPQVEGFRPADKTAGQRTKTLEAVTLELNPQINRIVDEVQRIETFKTAYKEVDASQLYKGFINLGSAKFVSGPLDTFKKDVSEFITQHGERLANDSGCTIEFLDALVVQIGEQLDAVFASDTCQNKAHLQTLKDMSPPKWADTAEDEPQEKQVGETLDY